MLEGVQWEKNSNRQVEIEVPEEHLKESSGRYEEKGNKWIS